ncbi:ROK family protein [bacterium]|nr:ROK family protein [bacterium]
MARLRTQDNRFMVGVDLGGTKILSAVLSPAGEILIRKKSQTRADRGPGEVIRRIVRNIQSVVKQSGIDKSLIAAVGIGSPGTLNPDTGVVEQPVNLPGWKDVPLKTILEKHLGLKVYLENDVNAGAYGEFRLGAGVGVRSMIALFIGTGIGGGMIIDGNLYQGFGKGAGELGHMVIQMDGPLCNCGRKGCFEAIAGRPALVRRIQKLDLQNDVRSLVLDYVDNDLAAVRSSHLSRAWHAADPSTTQALREMAGHTGLVVANLMHALNPELFVFGGGLIEALGRDLLPLIEQVARREALPNTSRNVRIRPAMLKDDAGVVGAAFLARERAGKRK